MLGRLKEVKLERHAKNGKMMCFVQFADDDLAEKATLLETPTVPVPVPTAPRALPAAPN